MDQDSTNNSEASRYFAWNRIHTKDPVPHPRCDAASVVVDGGLYIFGGCNDNIGLLDDFWYYSFDEEVWKELKPLSGAKPGPRSGCSLAASVSECAIYLFGGVREGKSCHLYVLHLYPFSKTPTKQSRDTPLLAQTKVKCTS